jgi:hypothetical protein
MNDEVEQDDRIQLPPGWGPVLFLAAVVILSDVALGLRIRSMLLDRTAPTSAMGVARPGGPGAGGGPAALGAPGGQAGQAGLPNVPLAGQPAPAAGGAGGPGGPGASAVPGSSYTIDDSEFTDELDAYIRQEAVAAGMAPDAAPTARQVYEQMQRSGLLPVNGDLDVRTVLGGHVREMAKHAAGGAGGPGAPGMAPGAPPQGAPPQKK